MARCGTKTSSTRNVPPVVLFKTHGRSGTKKIIPLNIKLSFTKGILCHWSRKNNTKTEKRFVFSVFLTSFSDISLSLSVIQFVTSPISFSLSVCLFICLFVCLFCSWSVSYFLCLSVCLSHTHTHTHIHAHTHTHTHSHTHTHTATHTHK